MKATSPTHWAAKEFLQAAFILSLVSKLSGLPMVLEKTLESPLNCKEIKPVNPKANEPCILIGRTDAEAEAPILWPPDAKSRCTGKDPDAGKD